MDYVQVIIEYTSLKFGCNAQYDESGTRTYSRFLKVREVGFLIFEIGMVRPTISIWNLTTISRHIIYLDANNLYGYAIYRFLPTSGFKLMDPKDLNCQANKSFIIH